MPFSVPPVLTYSALTALVIVRSYPLVLVDF